MTYLSMVDWGGWHILCRGLTPLMSGAEVTWHFCDTRRPVRDLCRGLCQLNLKLGLQPMLHRRNYHAAWPLFQAPKDEGGKGALVVAELPLEEKDRAGNKASLYGYNIQCAQFSQNVVWAAQCFNSSKKRCLYTITTQLCINARQI